MTAEDLTARVFGRLTVIGPAPRKGGRLRWRCRCECGTYRIVDGLNLRGGHSQSCGCLMRERLAASTRTHGLTNSPEYTVWCAVKARCLNPRNPNYQNYGGRGITVCDRWRDSFEVFLADVGPRPSWRHSLDRVDNDGPYSPDNCQWATRGQQANNCRSNHRLTFGGRTMTVAQWGKELRLKDGVIKMRLRLGWPIGQVLRPNLITDATRRTNHYVSYAGQTLCIADWSRQTGLAEHVIGSRLRAGWTPEQAITTPLLDSRFRRGHAPRRSQENGRDKPGGAAVG